jgi:hypothetical protein
VLMDNINVHFIYLKRLSFNYFRALSFYLGTAFSLLALLHQATLLTIGVVGQELDLLLGHSLVFLGLCYRAVLVIGASFNI